MNISKAIVTYSATADDFDSVETTLQNLLAEAENNCYRRDFETSFKYLIQISQSYYHPQSVR